MSMKQIAVLAKTQTPVAVAGKNASNAAKETIYETVLDKAISQVGKRENPVGSNWGEPVQSYLKSVGITFAASWCMAFVYWCFKEATSALGTVNNAIRTGGVLAAYNQGVKYRSKEPVAGSVFIMDFGNGLGHTGIVEKFDKDFIYTIEGNTNDTGSREGIEVCRRKRPRKSIKGYLNYY